MMDNNSANIHLHTHSCLQSYLRSTEFQKRGLPHTHILLTFEEADSPRTPADIDSIICAELPDKDNENEAALYDTVTRCMMHGPCGDDNPRVSYGCTSVIQPNILLTASIHSSRLI